MGSVQYIDDERIEVKILSLSACSSCHAKGACSAADMEEKVVDVENAHDHEYKVGDVVNITMNQSAGNKAVMLGYFLPFLLLVIVLGVSLSFFNEGVAGLLSVGSLIPYYLILYYTRHLQKKTFTFRLES